MLGVWHSTRHDFHICKPHLKILLNPMGSLWVGGGAWPQGPAGSISDLAGLLFLCMRNHLLSVHLGAAIVLTTVLDSPHRQIAAQALTAKHRVKFTKWLHRRGLYICKDK
jgi:hypothetical protein